MKPVAWTVLFAGPIVAVGSVEHLPVVVAALAAQLVAGIALAYLNGRTTRQPVYEPPAHVRLVGQPTTPAEDLLRMSWWNHQRAHLDGNGRVSKVGADRHSRLCVDDEGRVLCLCGLDDRDVSGGVA